MKQMQRSIGNLLIVFALFLATHMLLVVFHLQDMSAKTKIIVNEYGVYFLAFSVLAVYCGLKLIKKNPTLSLTKKIIGLITIFAGYFAASRWLINTQLGLIISSGTNSLLLLGAASLIRWIGSQIKFNGRKPEITGQEIDELIDVITSARVETDGSDNKKNVPVAVDFIKFSRSDEHCDLPMAVFSVYVTKKGESPDNKKYQGDLAYINGFKGDNHAICTFCHENHKITKDYGDDD